MADDERFKILNQMLLDLGPEAPSPSKPLDDLLSTFVRDRRMKVAAESYVPCHKLAS